jgi:hypothetical protein
LKKIEKPYRLNVAIKSGYWSILHAPGQVIENLKYTLVFVCSLLPGDLSGVEADHA